MEYNTRLFNNYEINKKKHLKSFSLCLCVQFSEGTKIIGATFVGDESCHKFQSFFPFSFLHLTIVKHARPLLCCCLKCLSGAVWKKKIPECCKGSDLARVRKDLVLLINKFESPA